MEGLMKYIALIIVTVLSLVLIHTSSAGATSTLPATPYYAALGDSVAAGAGLPLQAGASAEDSLCSRSPVAYPYQVAANLGTNVTHLACSGAKIDEGIYGPQERRGYTLAAQLDQAFSVGKPDVITVTIGANDARWIEFISKCYIATCGTTFDNAAVKVLRADLRIELATMLQKVKKLSVDATPPKVLIGGYYTPLTSTTCLGQDRITSAELSWIRTQTNSLNQALRSVIPYFSYAAYVPVNFTGHDLCSADPWVQGITASAPLHPTEQGQAAMARSFITVLSAPMARQQKMGLW